MYTWEDSRGQIARRLALSKAEVVVTSLSAGLLDRILAIDTEMGAVHGAGSARAC